MTRTFYRIETPAEGPPVCVAVELEPESEGRYWITGSDGNTFALPPAANGYAPDPDGAWELAVQNAEADYNAAEAVATEATRKWKVLRMARQRAWIARAAALEPETAGGEGQRT